jgi:hypothetical protein
MSISIQEQQMALTRPSNTAGPAAAATVANPASRTPAFEVEDANEPVVERISEAAKDAAGTALANVAQRAVVTAGRFKAILTEFENVLPWEQAESLKRVKAGAGVIRDSDGYNYGTFIDITLVSYHAQWVASPGVDGDEAKEQVRYSYDNLTISSDGSSLKEYIAMLKESGGYVNASVKPYTILVGILNGSQKGGGMEGDLVQISLSPQSRGSFDNYRIQAGVKQIQGRIAAGADMATFRVEAESKSRNDKDYTLLKVVSKIG